MLFSAAYSLTTARCGGGSRVAPVTPDASLPGAIDAYWVAPHLDKIDSPGTKACQTTWRLVTNIIHYLRENHMKKRGCLVIEIVFAASLILFIVSFLTITPTTSNTYCTYIYIKEYKKLQKISKKLVSDFTSNDSQAVRLFTHHQVAAIFMLIIYNHYLS